MVNNGGKEPWKWTCDEMAQAVIDGRYDFPTLGGDHLPASKEVWTIKNPDMPNFDIAKAHWDRIIAQEHEAVVAIAICEGKIVPQRVMAQYPNMLKGK